MKEMLDVPSSKENQVTLGDARDSELTSSYRSTLASYASYMARFFYVHS